MHAAGVDGPVEVLVHYCNSVFRIRGYVKSLTNETDISFASIITVGAVWREQCELAYCTSQREYCSRSQKQQNQVFHI